MSRLRGHGSPFASYHLGLQLLFALASHLLGASLGAALGEFLLGRHGDLEAVLAAAAVAPLMGWLVNITGPLVAAQFLGELELAVVGIGFFGTLLSFFVLLFRRTWLWVTALGAFSALWALKTLTLWQILLSV